MQLIRTRDAQAGTQAIVDRLITELQAGKRVLWFVTGGSNITIDADIMRQIPGELTPLLTITLTDERYGEPGHSDSNWQQLVAAGFEGKQATLLPVLASGTSLEETTKLWDAELTKALHSHDSKLAIFGMGGDGHIAGILPHTEAVDATGLACGYQTEEFSRITTTFTTIRQLDAAYVLAFGNEKRVALHNLERDLPLTEEPAQVLKELPEAYVYNDQVGEL